MYVCMDGMFVMYGMDWYVCNVCNVCMYVMYVMQHVCMYVWMEGCNVTQCNGMERNGMECM